MLNIELEARNFANTVDNHMLRKTIKKQESEYMNIIHLCIGRSEGQSLIKGFMICIGR